MDDFEYDQLVLRINACIEGFESLPDSEIKQDVFDLLKNLDLLHREALQRILNLLENEVPGLVVELQKDFVIQTLLILYEFVQLDEMPKPTQNNGSFIPIDKIGRGTVS
ncbi:MAG: hypothetical protein ACE5HO_09065 [bacterium]